MCKSPKSWRKFRLGELLEVGSGDSGDYRSGDYTLSIPVYGANGPIGSHTKANFGPGFVIGRVGAAGEVSKVDRPVWASDNTLTVKPIRKKCDFSFIGQVLHTVDFSKVTTQSAQPLLTQTKLKAIEVTIPPLPEQRRIADVLDTVDAAIQETDAVVEKQEQVKTGLLQDLLTRGLDADGRLRDPEREPEAFRESADFGLVPKRWSVKPVESIADLQVGYAFKSAWYQDTKGVRVLRGANVGYGQADWSETRRLPRSKAREFPEYELEAGDIVIGMDRPFTQQGFKLTVLRPEDVPSLLVQRVGRFIEKNCDARYLKGLLNSDLYKRELLSEQQGMDIPHISKTDILSAQMPIPPRTEQSRIGEALERNEKSIASEEQYGEKLQRLKTGLMQDLLTGRVRVPEAEARVDKVVA